MRSVQIQYRIRLLAADMLTELKKGTGIKHIQPKIHIKSPESPDRWLGACVLHPAV